MSTGIRDQDEIAEKRPKGHLKLHEPHQVLRDLGDEPMIGSAEKEAEIRSSKRISDELKKQKEKFENRIEPKEVKRIDENPPQALNDAPPAPGSGRSTPQIKGKKSDLGKLTNEADCPSGDCPDKETFANISGAPWEHKKQYSFFGNFENLLYPIAWQWLFDDNVMLNEIHYFDDISPDIFHNKWKNDGQSYHGGIIASENQKGLDHLWWRKESEFENTGKIQGKRCHWDFITHFRLDYVEETTSENIYRETTRLDGFNNEWGCLVWDLRDKDLIETMPIIVWGDTSIGFTFAEAFQRIHAYDDDPNKDSREDVQEYIETYTNQEPLIIINSDPNTDDLILDWKNIDDRHILMDISCRDTPSPFLEAGKVNGNTTYDTMGFLLYRIMTDWCDIMWPKAYKHIDAKRCIAYLREYVDQNVK